MLRELGARVVPSWAALETLAGPEARTKVVVLERVSRGGAYGDQEVADWVRDARRLATLEHPNVGRVRDVVISGDEVMVVSDYLDGVRWSELAASSPAQRVSLEIALRVLVDVLSGLSAVHNLRDAKREPLKLVHGELTPECVVVGLDGVARIVSSCRPKSATARPGRSGSAYLAPEVLLADESADARADVYSVGVMLWEALSSRPLFPNAQPSAIVTQLLSGRVARATVPEGAAWAEPLADVAARALSADPAKRFASAAAFAADLRRIAGPKLSPPVRAAAFIRGAFGDRITARRAELERGEVRAREVSGVDSQSLEDVPVEIDDCVSRNPTPVPPSTRSTRPPPPVEEAPQPQVVTMQASNAAQPAAPRPPPVPKARERLPTLTGVAPPAPPATHAETTGTPVVVPSSSRPPPPVEMAVPTRPAFVPPKVAAVPADLAAQVGALAVGPQPLPAVALEPAPEPAFPPAAKGPPPLPTTTAVMPVAPPPVVPLAPRSPPPVTRPVAAPQDAAAQPKKRSRAVVIALFAGPAALALALVVWRVGSGSSSEPSTSSSTAATSTASTPVAMPTVTAATTGTPDPAPPASAPTPTTTTSAATPPAATQPSPPSGASPEPPAAPPGTAVAKPPPFVAPTGWTAPPAPPRPGKRKYEPEGI